MVVSHRTLSHFPALLSHHAAAAEGRKKLNVPTDLRLHHPSLAREKHTQRSKKL
jgi:hypothetical protein